MPWVKGQSGNPGGEKPEPIEVKEVRKLAQTRSLEAYKVIDSLMCGAEKDSVRLAAALAMLKMAGLRFDSPPVQIVKQETQPHPATYSREALMAAAKGNA